MKRSSVKPLQALTALIGVGVLVFLLCEPHFEGRNTNATWFEIYFQDPFLAFAYVSSVPFFIALYQVFKLLGFPGREQSVSALRIIQKCGLWMMAYVVVGTVWLITMESDDKPPLFAMGAIALLFSLTITLSARAAIRRHSLAR